MLPVFSFLTATLLLSSAYSEENKTDIKIGFFIPYDIGGFVESKGLIPMGLVAQEQINNSTTFLPDYRLLIEHFNTKAESGKAIHQLFNFIGTAAQRNYVGIVGPVFTDVAKYISELAPFFNYVSVSPTASSFSLSQVNEDTVEDDTDQYIYRNSLRLHPVETDMYKAIFKLASKGYCNWGKIHILTGEGGENEFSSSVIKVFAKEADKKKEFEVLQYTFTSGNKPTIENAFEALKKNNARIIIANFDEDDAKRVFCIGKEKEFLSESPEFKGRRVWIIPSSYNNDWIQNAECPKDDVIRTVGTYLTPQFQWNTTKNDLATGYSFNETWAEYSNKFFTDPKYNATCGCSLELKAGSLMYDSVWTMAMGLHRFLYTFDIRANNTVEGRENGKEERAVLLRELLRRSGEMSSRLVDTMMQLKYEGASGQIVFNNDQDKTCRSGFQVNIQQLQVINNNPQDLDYRLVDVCSGKGTRNLECDIQHMWNSTIYSRDHDNCQAEEDISDTNGKNMARSSRNNETVTKEYGCRCPVDAPKETQVDKIIIGIPITTLVVFTIISSFGILLSTCFFIFNIVYMKERVIKMSSPQINNIILLGSLLLYSYVPISGLMTGVHGNSIFNESYLIKLCSFKLKIWLGCIGFTTSFGALFAKTWRVYAIFTSKKPRHMILSDWKLVVIVGILLLVDIILLGSDLFINKYKWAFQQTISSTEQTDLLDDTPDIRGIVTCEFDEVMNGRAEVPWLITIALIYKGLLLIFGAFIAFQTRNISIPALNDSKYIGISIYTTVVVVTICGPVSLFLKSQPDIQFGIISACIIFLITLMLCLVFLPKVYQLRYQPKEAIKNQQVREWDSVALSRKDSEIQSLLTKIQSSKSLRVPSPSPSLRALSPSPSPSLKVPSLSPNGSAKRTFGTSGSTKSSPKSLDR